MHTLGKVATPLPRSLKSRGGRGSAGGGWQIGEENGKETIRAEQSSPEELEVPRERQARSLDWRRGANRSGCHPLPGDEFERLQGPERAAGGARAGAPRRRLPPPRGRCVPGRRCHLHFARFLGPRAGVGMLTSQAFRERGCQGAVPEALRAFLLLIPGDCAGSGVEVRGVWPGPHSWEGGRRQRRRSEVPAGLTYPALSLPGLVFFCFESSCSLSRGNLGRRSPATVRVLGALWGQGETLWLVAGRP